MTNAPWGNKGNGERGNGSENFSATLSTSSPFRIRNLILNFSEDLLKTSQNLILNFSEDLLKTSQNFEGRYPSGRYPARQFLYKAEVCALSGPTLRAP